MIPMITRTVVEPQTHSAPRSVCNNHRAEQLVGPSSRGRQPRCRLTSLKQVEPMAKFVISASRFCGMHIPMRFLEAGQTRVASQRTSVGQGTAASFTGGHSSSQIACSRAGRDHRQLRSRSHGCEQNLRHGNAPTISPRAQDASMPSFQ